MNAQELYGYFENPALLGKDAVAQLDSLTREFPYFQSAQLLYLKGLHNENSFLYNNQLKLAAAYAGNRRVLYELITRKAETEKIREAVVAEKQAEIIAEPEPEKTEIVQPVSNIIVEEGVSWKENKSDERSESAEATDADQRQQQLLQHWLKNKFDTVRFEHQQQDKPESYDPEIIEQRIQKQVEEEVRKQLESVKLQQETSAEKEITEIPATEITTENQNESPDFSEALPGKEQMQQLLYVLIEPEPEDTEETVEIVHEIISEPSAETENLEYEVTPLSGEKKTEEAVTDPLTGDILREAISVTIQLEAEESAEKGELKDVVLQPVAVKKEAEPVTAPEEIKSEEKSGELSFADWLKSLSKTTSEQEKKPVTAEKPEEIRKAEPETAEEPYVPPVSQDVLIDKFIDEAPRIQPNKQFYSPVNMAKKSLAEHDDFITETLAKIYVKQGNFTKAMRAYRILSLKFPEKSSYFAALIEELKRTPSQKRT